MWFRLTQADTTSHLVVFNPLPIDAVIDLSFASELEVGPYIPRGLAGWWSLQLARW